MKQADKMQVKVWNPKSRQWGSLLHTINHSWKDVIIEHKNILVMTIFDTNIKVKMRG